MSRIITYMNEIKTYTYEVIEYYIINPPNNRDIFYGEINGCKRIINKSAYI